MTKPRVIILGHARHGKDTVAEWLQKRGYKFESSSYFMLTRVIWPILQNEWLQDNFIDHLIAKSPQLASIIERDLARMTVKYPTPEECFADRQAYRQVWYELINHYNNPLWRLTKEIFEAGNDLYVGLRNARELHAARIRGEFDLVLWVDASERKPPENSSSCTVAPWMADYILDNNGTLEDLDNALDELYNCILVPLEARLAYTRSLKK